MMSGKKCPWCEKTNFIADVVYLNAEYYGSTSSIFRCKHCKQLVKAYFKRVVVVDNIQKTDEDCDFTC